MSINIVVGKEDMVCTYNGILLSNKREQNNAMDGPGDCHLSELSQTEKDKYHMISLICGIFFTNMYKYTYLQNKSHKYRKQIYG